MYEDIFRYKLRCGRIGKLWDTQSGNMLKISGIISTPRDSGGDLCSFHPEDRSQYLKLLDGELKPVGRIKVYRDRTGMGRF